MDRCWAGRPASRRHVGGSSAASSPSASGWCRGIPRWTTFGDTAFGNVARSAVTDWFCRDFIRIDCARREVRDTVMSRSGHFPFYTDPEPLIRDLRDVAAGLCR